MKKTLPASHALIPDEATCVFKGEIFDIYQWPQTLFDGSTATFEMLRRPDTVQVIVVKGSQILLIEDEQPGRSPRLHFPGGRADEDTSWEAAAKRELLEETGLSCSTWRLVNVKQPLIKAEWFAPIFIATDISSQESQKLDAGERITVQWHEFDDVRAQVLSGKEQMMEYLIPFFNSVKTLDELVGLPKFEGQEVER